jgi:hypothetical protein
MSCQPGRRFSPSSERAGLRWAGGGGLVFATTVIIQNVLRGASAPSNGASSASIAANFTQHASIESLLVVLFTAGGFGLALFTGGVWARCVEVDPSSRPWAQTGLLGVAGIIALFSALVACEVALIAGVAREDLGGQTLALLWVVHNAVFAVLTLSIAIALLGLSGAAVRSGLIHARFRFIGIFGACLLGFNTAVAPLIVSSASPLMAVGLLGFACWVVFVVVTSYRLLAAEGVR